MTIEIRTIREQETAAWLACTATTFLERIDLAKVADALAAADRLLATHDQPWCSTFF